METQLKQFRSRTDITPEMIASWHIHWHIPNDHPIKQGGELSHIIQTSHFKMIVKYKEVPDINSKNFIVNVIDIKKDKDDTIVVIVQPSDQSKADHTMYVAGGRSREAVHAVHITNKFFLNFCRIHQN